MTAFNIQIVRTLREEVWRQFINEHPAANVFHTPEMFQVFALTKREKPELWAAVGDDSKVLALFLPVHITLINGLLRWLTTRSISYGSLLYQPDGEGRAALRQLLEAYTGAMKSGSLFTELRNLNDLTEIQPLLEEYNFVFEPYVNYLIDLNRPAEDVLQSIGSRTRKKIRKGLRDGHVQVSELTDRAELAHWYEPLLETYNKARIPLANLSLFEAAFDILYPKRMVKFLIARVQDKIAACSAELLFKNTIYGWYGGTNREYSDYLPNEMLMWHLLEWGANNGYHTYDFGGAGRSDEGYGVRDFKAKFGGDLVCFGRNIWVHNPILLKLSKQGYEVYRRFL